MKRKQEYMLPGLATPISHYCDAVQWGDLLFVSGMAPLDGNGRLVSDDVVAQTHKVFENLKAALDAAGASFEDVLKVTVFLTNVNDRTRINPVRQQYFGDARPASTLIGVKELAIPGMKVEIEAVVGLHNQRG